MTKNEYQAEECKLQAARVNLLTGSPFFATIAMRRPLIVTPDVETAAVTADGSIKFNPAFVNDHTKQELTFVLAHEAMHVALAHLARMGSRNSAVWNIATDAVINALLRAERVGQTPQGAVFLREIDGLSAEEIYERLMKNNPPKPRKPQSQGAGDEDEGDGSNGIGDGPTIKDLLPEEAEAAGKNPKTAEREGNMEIVQAYNVAKMCGRGSDVLGKFVGQIVEKKTPWHELLERFMTTKAERHLSWARPNKRYPDMYLPRRTRLPAMGDLSIVVDVSGSIGSKELSCFLSHVLSICEMTHPKSVRVLYTTEVVEECAVFENYEDVTLAESNRWYGGTDMRAAFKYLVDHDMASDAVVVLTDGYTPYPRVQEFPTLWVLTKRVSVPAEAGESVFMEDIDE